MDSSIEVDLYLAFLNQQIEEVRNSISILREAIIQMVADEDDTKQQSEALLSLLDEMICLKAIRKDLFDGLGSNDAGLALYHSSDFAVQSCADSGHVIHTNTSAPPAH
jgi:hypothetical protein